MLKRFSQLLTVLFAATLLAASQECHDADDDDASVSLTPGPTGTPEESPPPSPPPDPTPVSSPFSTPIPLPEGSCRSGIDCQNGEMCIAPGDSIGCGMCYQAEDQCTIHEDCGEGFACGYDPAPCQCNGPARICLPECTASSCSDGEKCGDEGLCQTIHCTEGTFTCPDLTTCTPEAPGNGCVRWSCTGDAECGGHNICVNGKCYDAFGNCSYPPP